MYRSEKMNSFIALLMVAALLLSVPVAMLRLRKAYDQITGRDRTLYSGEYGTITDRFGNIIYESGSCTDSTVYGSVVGDFYGDANTLARSYGSELAPEVHPIFGLSGGSGNTMKTTLLDAESLQLILDAFGSKSGAAYAYNYLTGEVYAMVSSEKEYQLGENRCLSGLFIPGSTMKIVASICALEQGVDLDAFHFYCGGSEACSNIVHGNLDYETALGYSCNSAFYELIRQFDPERTREILTSLGFHLEDGVEIERLGELQKTVSTTRFSDIRSPEDVWGLIGQGVSTVNLMDMAKIAGAVANGGSSAEPRLVDGIISEDGTLVLEEQEPQLMERFSADTAVAMDLRWSEMVEVHYRSGANALDNRISYAKTGTAQRDNSNPNKLLMGVSKDCETAFVIAVENYEYGDPLPSEIANLLIQVIDSKLEPVGDENLEEGVRHR